MNTKQVIRAATPRMLRNWLRQPRKTLGYMVDHATFALGVSQEVQALDNWVLRCHPASLPHFSVFRTDPLQAQELQDFVRYSTPGMHLLDVGAHHGFFSLAALYFGGASSTAVALEPSLKSARVIRSNLKLNGLADRVLVIEAAGGKVDGVLEMLTTGPAGSNYLIVPRENRTDTTKVRQLSISSILKETGFVPTHVKVDVEGYEEEVLLGGEAFFRATQPVLFLELHGDFIRQRGYRPESIIELLRSWGYQRFISSGEEQSDVEMGAANYNCRLTCMRSEY